MEESRLDKIERLLEATARIALRSEEAILKLIQGQELQQKSMAGLIELHKRTEEELAGLAQIVRRVRFTCWPARAYPPSAPTPS